MSVLELDRDDAAEMAPAIGAPETLILNRRDTAVFFKVSEPTVDRWVADDCPVDQRGGNGVAYQFDVYRVQAWRAERAAAELEADEEKQRRIAEAQSSLFGDRHADADLDPLSPSAQKIMLEAQLRRVQLGRERGTLLVAAELKLPLASALQALRDQLRAMPETIGRQHGLDDRVVVAIAGSVDNALDAMVDKVGRIVADLDQGGDDARPI